MYFIIYKNFMLSKVTPYFVNHYINGSDSRKFNLNLILYNPF